ncbi:MAG: C2H2-type zinc finger protein [Patescibacteria group bacterium]|nr:C2H2-type zinc finger protein [Patescibacteria group bacterium]
MSEIIKNENNSFMCRKCDRGFSNLSELKIHEKNHAFDDLKNEVLENINIKKEKKIQWDSFFVTIILIILVSVASVQAYESRIIFEKIKSGDFKATSGSNNGTSLPSSIENLPNMVGGC